MAEIHCRPRPEEGSWNNGNGSWKPWLSSRKTSPLLPRVGVVLGSGLGEFADRVAEKTVIDYADIPHFKKVSVAGHAGRLVLGRVGSVPVAVLQGRYHYYEGHDISDVVFPVRVLAKLGIAEPAADQRRRRHRPGPAARRPDGHPRPHQPDGRSIRCAAPTTSAWGRASPT